MSEVVNEKQRVGTLQDAVERLYAVFGCYRVPKGHLNVCTHCCMDPDMEKEMRKIPLRKLTAKHFFEFNTAAKDAESEEEVKYFLPRLLELLAQGEDVHHSMELYLQRLGNCPADVWSTRERAAMDAFALAFFAQGLAQPLYLENGLFQGERAFDILLMFEVGGFPLEPLLDYWQHSDNVQSTLHYIEAMYWNQNGPGNPFAGDRPVHRETLERWFDDASTKERFSLRILALDTTELVKSEVWGSESCRVPIELMIAAVFDRVA